MSHPVGPSGCKKHAQRAQSLQADAIEREQRTDYVAEAARPGKEKTTSIMSRSSVQRGDKLLNSSGRTVRETNVQRSTLSSNITTHRQALQATSPLCESLTTSLFFVSQHLFYLIVTCTMTAVHISSHQAHNRILTTKRHCRDYSIVPTVNVIISF